MFYISLEIVNLLWHTISVNKNSNHSQKHSHYSPMVYVEEPACIVTLSTIWCPVGRTPIMILCPLLSSSNTTKTWFITSPTTIWLRKSYQFSSKAYLLLLPYQNFQTKNKSWSKFKTCMFKQYILRNSIREKPPLLRENQTGHPLPLTTHLN